MNKTKEPQNNSHFQKLFMCTSLQNAGNIYSLKLKPALIYIQIQGNMK